MRERYLIPFLFFLSSGAVAETVPSRETVCAAARAEQVPGVAFAIVSASARQIGYCGTVDPDDVRAVGGNTPFEAASLSKTVFATLLVDSMPESGLALDASLATTGAPKRVKDDASFALLTPRLILSHQSGLPNWSGDARDPDRDDPLDFKQPPGSGYGYSGEAYELLKAHAEAVTGLALEDWFSASRGRFGMPHSSYLGPAAGADETIAASPDGNAPRPLSLSEHALAAASLITTADDYGRFLQYLLANPSLLEVLLEPQVRVDAATTGELSWGLGWGIYERSDGSAVGFHWGDNYQFKSFVAIDADAGSAVVFFANGYEGLRLVSTIVEPVVGDLGPVRDWLGYESDGA